jgi:hypothetical protein
VCCLQALLKLCRFRNYHPAFKGNVFVDDSTPPHLLVSCTDDNQQCWSTSGSV